MKEDEREQIASRFEKRSYKKRKFFNILSIIIGVLFLIGGVALIALGSTPFLIAGSILGFFGVVTLISAAIYQYRNDDI